MSELAAFLRVYVLPAVVISGVTLNLLSFFVMRNIRSSATSHYMSCLGLVDSAVLLVGGMSLWMDTVFPDFSIPMLSTVMCKLTPFLIYSFSDLSVFVIVTMTAERFYAVWRPFQVVFVRVRGVLCSIRFIPNSFVTHNDF